MAESWATASFSGQASCVAEELSSYECQEYYFRVRSTQQQKVKCSSSECICLTFPLPAGCWRDLWANGAHCAGLAPSGPCLEAATQQSCRIPRVDLSSSSSVCVRKITLCMIHWNKHHGMPYNLHGRAFTKTEYLNCFLARNTSNWLNNSSPTPPSDWISDLSLTMNRRDSVNARNAVYARVARNGYTTVLQIVVVSQVTNST